MTRRPKRLIALLFIFIVIILMLFPAYAGDNDTVFGDNFNLEAFCMVFWPVYPNYEGVVSSETWYPTPSTNVDVSEIQAVGDIFIDDVFIERIDQFGYDSYISYDDTDGRIGGQKISIECFHYAYDSTYNELLSTYTDDYEFH